jgi:hypothetical protein
MEPALETTLMEPFLMSSRVRRRAREPPILYCSMRVYREMYLAFLAADARAESRSSLVKTTRLFFFSRSLEACGGRMQGEATKGWREVSEVRRRADDRNSIEWD